MVFTVLITLYSRSVLEVSVNGKKIGNVKNHQALNEIKTGLKERYKNKLGADVEFVQDIKAAPVKALGQKLDTEDEMLKKLESALTYRLKAVAININGKEIAMVKDIATAEKVLEQVKDYYISETPGELIKLEVVEKVKLVERYVYPKEVITPEEAKDLILKGGVETRTYEVVQETVFGPFHEREHSLDDLIKANPQLKSENELALGDIINLTK